MKDYPIPTSPQELLSLVRGYTDQDLPRYSSSLLDAFASCDPVFTRPGYSAFFWHCASTVPGWLPQVVLSNAEAESHGSAKLLKLWKRVDYNDRVEKQILVHAKDESRHSRLFIDLTEIAFPKVVDESFLGELRTSLPDIRYTKHDKAGGVLAEDALIDALVQMNIGEIRTRIHLELLAPIIRALTPQAEREKVERILRGLARDEVRHIAYTARLMEEWAADGAGELIQDLYARRLHDFNLITISQTEGSMQEFGAGRFPRLLEV